MPVRKGKNARVTRVHDNPRRPRRGTENWFDEYYRDLYNEDWNPDKINEQIEEKKDENTDPT